METKIYVDVLLVVNYIINMLLLACTAKLTGRRSKRRRMVAAALFGSASSLTIFLPFFGFAASILTRLLLAAAIVLIAFPPVHVRLYAKQLFVFFCVSFFFSGVMLALWMVFTPHGMLYYNGVVYFDVSSMTLIVTTAAAYGILTLANRFSRGGRVSTAMYTADIGYRGKSVRLRGLVDTGNRLYEPFSDLPVMVCGLEAVSALLPPGVAEAIAGGEHLKPEFGRYEFPIRLVPFADVGGQGMIAAFRPDTLLLSDEKGKYKIEAVYIGLSPGKVGGAEFDAILNPDLVGIRI